MALSLDGVAVLDAIARKGSFAAAADELHRVPSAITYAVQKLEEDMGVALFDRSGHKATLTDAGAELLREGRNLLRAAAALEARVQQVARGYEPELRIAVSDLIPMERLHPLLKEFYLEACGTRLRLSTEVYGGSWDALTTGRADLVIGAPGEGPSGGGYAEREMGRVEFEFVVAPLHPLAVAPEPLRSEQILHHRAVSAADSSRNLPPRTSGLLSGQDVLTVPDLHAKLAAHRDGLGVGYLPRSLALEEAAAGRLVIKQVEEPKPATQLSLAWHSGCGRAARWFVDRLSDKAVLDMLLP
jgi:DNA-binding transcriptional LysR family regulator